MSLSIFFPFALLFTLQLIADAFVQMLGLPIPGSVIGAIFLLALLFRFPVLHEKIAPTCHTLIKNMLLLYVPISVGLMDRMQMLKENFWMLTVTLIFSTLVTAYTTALIFQKTSHQTLRKNAVKTS